MSTKKPRICEAFLCVVKNRLIDLITRVRLKILFLYMLAGYLLKIKHTGEPTAIRFLESVSFPVLASL